MKRPSPAVAPLLLAVLLPARAPAVERARVPEEHKWDLSDVFPSEAAWAKSRGDLAARVPKLAAFQGTLGESAGRFYEALSAYMGVDRDLSRLEAYAGMRADEDARVGAARELKESAQDLRVKLSAAAAYLTPEIVALGPAKVAAFAAADARLSPYAPWLKDLLRYAPHTLSAGEERVAAQAQAMAEGPESIFDILTNADLPYPEVVLPSGATVRLDEPEYETLRASPDRAVRELAFRSFWKTYAGFTRTLGTTLSAQVKAHVFDARVHKYAGAQEAALFRSNVPVGVYDRLIADARTNLPTLHRYLKLRQRMMGLPTLRYEDLYAPLVGGVDLRYTPEQAKELVLEAVAPLGPRYVEDLRTMYARRWIDFLPNDGKKSGAYSTGVYGVHPYQMENFTGSYSEVSTLAHESGHSMHTWLSDRAQPYPTHDYKIFVAEVASTLNENLLLHHVLAGTKDRDVRLALLGKYLEMLRTTLFRQVLFADFEQRVHALGDKGEPITGEKLSRLYLSVAREYYGAAQGVCAIDDLYGAEWAYVPHFYYDFYVYQYATSLTASSALAAAIRDEAAAGQGTARRDAYLAMLAAGSSKDPIDLLQDAGVDMTTSAPFDAAMKEMNGVMDEMDKLLAQAPGK